MTVSSSPEESSTVKFAKKLRCDGRTRACPEVAFRYTQANSGLALAVGVALGPAAGIAIIALILKVLTVSGVIEPGPYREWFALCVLIAPVWAFCMGPAFERWAARFELAPRVRTRVFLLPPNGWLGIRDGELTAWTWRRWNRFGLRDEPVRRLPAAGWSLELPPPRAQGARHVTLTDPEGRSVPLAFLVGAELEAFATLLRDAQPPGSAVDGDLP